MAKKQKGNRESKKPKAVSDGSRKKNQDLKKDGGSVAGLLGH